jgi:hypothetical protein
MELLITAIIVGLVIWGLERNNNRPADHPHLNGSTDIQNRDKERLTTDLHTLA